MLETCQKIYKSLPNFLTRNYCTLSEDVNIWFDAFIDPPKRGTEGNDNCGIKSEGEDDSGAKSKATLGRTPNHLTLR